MMPDPNTPTAPGNSAGTAPEPASAQTQTAGAGDTGEKRFTQDELNAINARDRRARERAEAELAKLQAKLGEIEQAKLSEHERAIADATNRAATERDAYWQAELAKRDREQAIKDQLVLQGSKPSYARLVEGVETPEDATEAVRRLLADHPNLLSQVHASQPGSPSGRVTDTRWTPERIREVVARGEYDKYRAEILAAQTRR
jgi:hypothetical protein